MKGIDISCYNADLITQFSQSKLLYRILYRIFRICFAGYFTVSSPRSVRRVTRQSIKDLSAHGGDSTLPDLMPNRGKAMLNNNEDVDIFAATNDASHTSLFSLVENVRNRTCRQQYTLVWVLRPAHNNPSELTHALARKRRGGKSGLRLHEKRRHRRLR